MKKSGGLRRVPRKIGSDDEEPSHADAGSAAAQPALIRPSSKPRKAPSLRTAFQPGDDEDEDSQHTGVVAPKKSKLSRVAIHRNASQRSSLLTGDLPRRELQEAEDGPSYNAAALQQLKDSTPATPHDLTTDASNSEIDDVSNETKALDLSSKFGASLARYQQPSAIPSATEIAEKKARRARLAKEHAAEEFISLDPSDPELDNDDDENVTRNEHGHLVLEPTDKYGASESRLVHDDEDIMENFEVFTEADSKIVFGRKANAEAAQKRKAEMAAQIAQAEGASDSGSDASERERNEAFEAAQTKHGTYGSNTTSIDPYANMRPKTPPIISPLPTLDGVIERLRKQVSDLQTSRMQKLQEMEALQREKIRLGEEEVRVQRALKETAEKFEVLRSEKGIIDVSRSNQAPAFPAPGPDSQLALAGESVVDEQGDSDAEGDNELRGGLGSGLSPRSVEVWTLPRPSGNLNGGQDAPMADS